ncbi:MAG: branched-chain amino acid transport system substrate-binding protein, partial [Planctomycetota bacterium]
MIKEQKMDNLLNKARVIRLAAGLSMLLTSLGACGSDDKSTNTADNGAEPIKIGLLTTLTGALARQGQTYRATTEMARDEINEAGGVLGRPIELVIADTQTDPTAAVVAAQRLVDQGVVAIAGPVISSSTLEVAASVAIPQQVPIIANAATSPAISSIDDGGMVWRTALSDAFKGSIVARFAFEQGRRRAAVLHVDNSFGHGMAGEFSAAFTALGGEVIVRTYYPELSADEIRDFDYRPIVEEVLSDKPDLLY